MLGRSPRPCRQRNGPRRPVPVQAEQKQPRIRLFEARILSDPDLSDRKRRLFALACLNRFAHLLTDSRSRQALLLAEAYVLGQASAQELEASAQAAFEAYLDVLKESWEEGGTHHRASWAAAQLSRAAALIGCDGVFYAEDVADYVRRSLPAAQADEEEFLQCRLLEEIVGPTFPESPPLDPSWKVGNDGEALRLAEWIDAEQAFEVLPILADALEEVGCVEERILRHCRESNQHVRGCWVIDWLLERQSRIG